MQLSVRDKQPFTIVGVDMRTTNQNGESMHKIPAFWQKFYRDQVIARVPSVVRPEIVYAVYSDYDERGYYSMLIGVESSSKASIPQGLASVTLPASKYAVMTAKGAIAYAVPSAWEYIWSHDFPYMRAFRADFEVYDQRSKPVRDAEVDLYISIF